MSFREHLKRGHVVEVLKSIDDENSANIALEFSINNGHAVMAIEVFLMMNAKGWDINFDVERALEKPSLDSIAGLDKFDTNDLTDLTTLRARLSIINNLILPYKFSSNSVDENMIETCYEVGDYGEDADRREIDWFMADNPASFVFVELRGNLSPLVSCITKDGLKSYIDSHTARFYHCLGRDEDLFDGDSKTMGHIGNFPLIKIPNSIGTWFVYLENLKTAINVHKAAIIYLRPAMKIKWKMSGAVKFITSASAMVSNSHCQDENINTIYALELCNSKNRPLSGTYNLSDWKPEELDDLWKIEENDWDTDLAIGIRYQEDVQEETDGDYHGDDIPLGDVSSLILPDLGNSVDLDINNIINADMRSSPGMYTSDRALQYAEMRTVAIRDRNREIDALLERASRRRAEQYDSMRNMLSLELSSLTLISTILRGVVSLEGGSMIEDNMSQNVEKIARMDIILDDAVLDQMYIVDIFGLSYSGLIRYIDAVNVVNGPNVLDALVLSLINNNINISIAHKFMTMVFEYTDHGYNPPIASDGFSNGELSALDELRHVMSPSQSSPIFTYIDVRSTPFKALVKWLSENIEAIEHPDIHMLLFMLGIGTPTKVTRVIKKMFQESHIEGQSSSLPGIAQVWYRVFILDPLTNSFPLQRPMTLFELNLVVFYTANVLRGLGNDAVSSLADQVHESGHRLPII